MSSVSDDIDHQIRIKAFEHLVLLTKQNRPLHFSELQQGIIFKDARIPLFNLYRGIFKPQAMKYLLSVQTSIPKTNKAKYEDQGKVYRQINEGVKILDYSFMGNDPLNAANQHLLRACQNRIPIIYFIGIEQSYYIAQFPVYVVDWIPEKLKARVDISYINTELQIPDLSPTDKEYALTTVKVRLHQAKFRKAVMNAYDYRCAISGFPETSGKDSLHKGSLIDVAHIIADRKHDVLSKPDIGNGIPLTKLHHAAYDANLIGIDPDYGLHVSKSLWNTKDGQTLELLKSIEGNSLRLPKNRKHFPDPERLSIKFQEFENLAR